MTKERKEKLLKIFKSRYKTTDPIQLLSLQLWKLTEELENYKKMLHDK